MTREIKFRAWDAVYKEMFVPLKLEWRGLGRVCFYNKYHQWNDQMVLMQFTGLLDKNGREIYEGDILQFEYYYDRGQWGEYKTFSHTVKWLDEDCGFYPICKTDNYTMPRDRYEVIGNIYENPELLAPCG